MFESNQGIRGQNAKPQLTEYQLRFCFNRGLYWIRTSDPYPVKVML